MLSVEGGRSPGTELIYVLTTNYQLNPILFSWFLVFQWQTLALVSAHLFFICFALNFLFSKHILFKTCSFLNFHTDICCQPVCFSFIIPTPYFLFLYSYFQYIVTLNKAERKYIVSIRQDVYKDFFTKILGSFKNYIQNLHI